MANAQVNVITIEVEGTLFTQTRPGYYYKKTAEGQKRIPKSEWEIAFEQYLQTGQDNADSDAWEAEANAELEARKEAEDRKDRETEAAFNGHKTLQEHWDECKAKRKPRRSKDIAHESNGVTLTAKQVDFIKHIPDTNFYEHGLDSMPWCDVLADEIGGQFAGKPMTVGAMISTLREKNLIYVGVDRINGKKAKYFGFTELGKKVATELGLQ